MIGELKPGFYREQQTEALKKFEYISFSKIKYILESRRAFFRHYAKGQVAEPSKAMEFGNKLHLAALEPGKFRDRFVVQPEFTGLTQDGQLSTRSKEAKAKKERWLANLRADAVVVEPEEFEAMVEIVDNLLAHKDAKRLLSGGKSEGWLYVWDEFHGIWQLARPDFLTNDFITVELKTTSLRNLNARAWAREVFKQKYHVQLAHNHRAVRLHYGLPDSHRKGAWVVAQSMPPYDVAVFTASENMMIAGEEKAFRAYNEINDMLEKDPELKQPALWTGNQIQAEEVDLEPWMIDNDEDHISLNQMDQA